jgi:ribosomal-protein-alanine N-acetyltransferase
MAYEPFPTTFPELVGDGLVLRELCEADLPAWFERLSDPHAAALAGDPVATSAEAVIQGLAHHRAAFRERTGLRWAIVPTALSASVGSVGLFRFDQGARTAEIGAAIGRAHWARGVATRAGRLVLEYGFSALGLEAIEAVVLPENAGTLRVLEKLGFAQQPRACPRERLVAGRPDSQLFICRRAVTPLHQARR